MAWRWCSASGDADDIAQEAVLRFLAAVPCPDNETAWLFVVIRRMSMRERERDLRRGDAEAAFESLRPPRLERSQLLEIEQVLDSLTERDRRLILLVIEGEDTREIARRFNCNIRDVGQMVSRVRKRARAIRGGIAVRKRAPQVSSLSRRNNLINLESETTNHALLSRSGPALLDRKSVV